jgi:hypothetical protein
MLTRKMEGRRAAVVWPEKTADIEDRNPMFLLGYLPPESAERNPVAQEKLAREFFENCGDRQRRFRNGIGLAIPQASAVNALRRATRYLLAVEKVESNKSQHKLTKDQLDQLKERGRTEMASIESSFRDLYTAVWLPRMEEGQIQIEKVELGGRALTATTPHERMMELVTVTTNKVFGTISPRKIVELMKIGEPAGEGQPVRAGVKLAEAQEAFFSIYGFTRLDSSEALRKAVARGVEGANPAFGYWSGADPVLDADGRYQINRERVVYGRGFDPSEVDFETGFLIAPSAIPLPPQPAIVAPAPEPSPAPSDAPITTEGTAQPGITPPAPAAGPVSKNIVRLSFKADRDKLFAAWNALANLADKAGEISVEVTATKPSGFDQTWLRNAVYEPLEEADIFGDL